MAVSTSSYFGNGKIQGNPQVAVDFDKFASDATPKYALGYRIEDSDGNVYRYGHFGADTARGVVVAQDVSESSLGDSDNVIVASASCTVTTDGTVGSSYFEVTAGNSTIPITVNEFAGGRLVIIDDKGEGYTYNIIGNTANATEGSTIRVQIREKLQSALDATSDFIIMGNRYANLEIASNGTDCIVAGVTCRSMTTTRPYGWVQTKGVVGILTSGTNVIGENIALSSATSGAVGCYSDATVAASLTVDQVLGACLIAGDTSGHGVYYINVD